MDSIDPEKITNELISFIKNAFAKAGFSRAVIGLSGGVDSATCYELAVRALGKENVFPYFLPYGNQILQNSMVIDIKPIVDSIIALDPSMDNIRRGNIMARVRMTILFDQAKKRRALVVGTENKTEHILGYYTRFGDEASDIEPLRNLYKIQVFQLAKFLNIPQEILNKPPTAGLWEGQTDEGEFGFTYKEADEILVQLYDQKKSIEEIVTSGLDRTVVEKVQSWVASHAFKHNLPILP